MAASEKPKPTQLRQLYEALPAFEQAEQVAFAELHAQRPGMMRRRIKNDLRCVGGYEVDRGHPMVGSRRKTLPTDVDVSAITSTPAFAAALRDRKVSFADRDLAFEYVEREVVPLRGLATSQRSMDLLLRTRMGRPILGELKLGTDNLPYYAFVQLLMHAVELASPDQRARLRSTAREQDLRRALTRRHALGRQSADEEKRAATRADTPHRLSARRLGGQRAAPRDGVRRRLSLLVGSARASSRSRSGHARRTGEPLSSG